MSEGWVWQDEQGRGYAIPEGYEPKNSGRCGTKTRPGCGRIVAWCRTPKGKMSPVNPNGTSHWSTCEMAASFRKPQQEQEQPPWPTEQR